jgi:hypothetical protein
MSIGNSIYSRLVEIAKLESQPFVIGINRDRLQRRGFSDFESAFEWAVADRTAPYNFQTFLETGIKGELEDRDGREHIQLRLRGKTVWIPRRGVGGEDGITVSTNYKSYLNLCIPIWDYEDAVFDRGLAWLHIFNSQSTVLSFGLHRNHQATVTELVKRTRYLTGNIIQLLDDIAQGK